MRNTKESTKVFYGLFGIQFIYLVIVYISTVIKSFMFVDFFYVIPYLIVGIIISLILSFILIVKLRNNNIEMITRLNTFLLLQIPSTLGFLFTLYIVFASHIDY
ncbi:MAG: hypothetical protein KQ78_01248 [Candidatus Izimaplasma bacterium HR2]|nr:MAG: hypothetical protein KQ78_01248 [Candidatus Izimaplasma bacterium HR2]